MITVTGKTFAISLKSRYEYGTNARFFWLNIGIIDSSGMHFYFDTPPVKQSPKEREAWEDVKMVYEETTETKKWMKICKKTNTITSKIKLERKITVSGHIYPSRRRYTRLTGVVKV